MRAIRVKRFGGPEVLETERLPDPVAGPGEVVIELSYADVLFLDTQLRSGWGAEFFALTPPYVPGNGGAGRVISTGEGVDSGWVGRTVVAHTGGNGGRGGYAEHATVDVDQLVPVPDGLDLRDAAALLHDGPTALGLINRARIRTGEWVLVAPAAGGLGSLLVQLAHAAGARVAGVARGKRKLDLALELGAETVADYSETGWAERVREASGGDGFDVVFDGVGGQIGRAAFEIAAQGGRFSGYGAPSGAFSAVDREEVKRRGVTYRGIDQIYEPAEAKHLIARALSDAAAGRIRPVIGQTFPLDRASDAHSAMEARETIGKTLLLM